MSYKKLGANKRQRMRNQLQHARDARQYRRLLAVLECDRGKSVNDVAFSSPNWAPIPRQTGH
jgi:hypothetical protein